MAQGDSALKKMKPLARETMIPAAEMNKCHIEHRRRRLMARGPNEEPDLDLTEELLFAGQNLQLERFDRAETVAGRTPDFRVRRDGALVAYCEVKSPRDDFLEEQLDRAEQGRIVGGVRSDPTFNRIARHVLKAATQFEAVNVERLVPNILVFVNHADANGIADLQETLTGMFHTADGERIPTMTNVSEGRLGETRFKIDLYVWIDNKTRRVQGYLFSEAITAHVETLCVLLGLDQSQISR